MRAVSLDDADFFIGVAKGDQILTEQAHGRAIRMGNLVGQHRRSQNGRNSSPMGIPGPTREFVVLFA